MWSYKNTITSLSGLVNHLKLHGYIKSKVVEDVMLRVDRKIFCPSSTPYEDRPQSISYGQTISAPHMHAYALELLADFLKPGMKALDVGSGSGYLTACMARMVCPDETSPGVVYGIEYVPQLVSFTKENLKKDEYSRKLMSLKKIIIQQGDGWKGLPNEGPFNAIHVGAAAESLPQALVDQLAKPGRLFIPIGPQGGMQYLYQIDKDVNGNVSQKRLLGVSYVPLVKDMMQMSQDYKLGVQFLTKNWEAIIQKKREEASRILRSPKSKNADVIKEPFKETKEASIKKKDTNLSLEISKVKKNVEISQNTSNDKIPEEEVKKEDLKSQKEEMKLHSNMIKSNKNDNLETSFDIHDVQNDVTCHGKTMEIKESKVDLGTRSDQVTQFIRRLSQREEESSDDDDSDEDVEEYKEEDEKREETEKDEEKMERNEKNEKLEEGKSQNKNQSDSPICGILEIAKEEDSDISTPISPAIPHYYYPKEMPKLNQQSEEEDFYVEQDLSHLSPFEQKIFLINEKYCREWRSKIYEILQKTWKDEPKIIVQVDWQSFDKIFEIYNEEQRIEILDGMMSRSGIFSLIMELNNYLETNEKRGYLGLREFLKQHLTTYVIRYAANSKNGYYKDGIAIDTVEVFVQNSGVKWKKKSFTEYLIKCVHLQKFVIQSILLPEYEECISGVMESKITLRIDWESINKSNDSKLCINKLFYGNGKMVLERISRAFDDISSFDSDEVVEIVGKNIKEIIIVNGDKDHSFDHLTNKLIISQQLDGPDDELYTIDDLIAIIKYSSVYVAPAEFSQVRISSAASLGKLIEGDLSLFLEIVRRNELAPSTIEEQRAFDDCIEIIKELYEDERIIKCWHIIKFNNMNMAQERILVATDKAYYTFNHCKGNLEKIKFKKHLIKDIVMIEIGATICKIYTKDEIKKKSFSLKFPKSKVDFEPAAIYKSRAATIMATRRATILPSEQYLQSHEKTRIKQVRPEVEKPDVTNNYSNIFTAFHTEQTKDVIHDISWTLYGLCNYQKGKRTAYPFISQTTERPQGGLTAFVYNNLKMGMKTKIKAPAGNWVEFVNPLYQIEDEDSFLYHLKIKSLEVFVPIEWVETLNPLHSHYKVGEVGTLDENLKKAEQYQVEKRLASGSEGSVFLATHKKTGKKFVLKTMNYTSQKAKKRIDNEIQLVLRLDHTNIVKHYEIFVLESESLEGKEEILHLVMEYCSTSIENLIKNKKGPFKERVIFSWIKQILSGLHYLHSNKIIHRDIKTDNILLKNNSQIGNEDDFESWYIKLCDFGFSTDLNKLKENTKPGGIESGITVGTPLYMAPEIIMFKPYNTAVDIWSLGVVILQILMNKPANEMINVFQMVMKQKDYIKELCEKEKYDPVLSKIVYECCKCDPKERPTAAQLLEEYFSKKQDTSTHKLSKKIALKKKQSTQKMSVYKIDELRRYSEKPSSLSALM